MLQCNQLLKNTIYKKHNYKTLMMMGERVMKINFCSSCGGKVTQEGDFCESCGNKLSSTKKEQVREEQVEMAPGVTTDHKQLRPRNYKYIILAVAVCIGIFVLLNLNSPPEKVAEKFVKDLYSLKVDKLDSYISPQLDPWVYEELQETKEYLNMFGLTELKMEGYTPKKIQVVDADIEDNIAFVNTKVIFHNNEMETNYVELKKHGGKWKIIDFY